MYQPKILRMTFDERKESVDKLIDSSEPNAEFFLMLVLSTAIIVPGLLLGNESVIIGGMVVAPLLAPILSLSLGVVISDFKLIARSVRTMVMAAVTIIVFSFVIGLFYDGAVVNEVIMSRTRVSLAYLLIAIASGTAAAFALAKPNLSPTLPGVAVAVALLPPLAVTGIGFSFLNWRLVTGGLELFLVNLVGMQFAALVVYSLMGYYPARRQVDKKLEDEEIRKQAEKNIRAEEKKIEQGKKGSGEIME